LLSHVTTVSDGATFMTSETTLVSTRIIQRGPSERSMGLWGTCSGSSRSTP
jgi:hypothetical protein